VIYEAFARVGRIASPTIAGARGAAVGAGLNLLLATDARIVATDARLFSGFLPLGLHPGGGHFTLLARTGGRELAAALGLFGEELTGAEAAARGLAWAAVRAEDVDAVATELAHRAGRDPELARAVVHAMRLELGPPPTPWPVALEAETARQIWSMRRRAD
jgi:enoyl-CoA hydratase